MLRIMISLHKEEKAWLATVAKKQRLSIAAVIRQAIALYRQELERKQEPTMDELLEQTKGIWTEGDGLDYQQQLREEWEQPDEEDS